MNSKMRKEKRREEKRNGTAKNELEAIDCQARMESLQDLHFRSLSLTLHSLI